MSGANLCPSYTISSRKVILSSEIILHRADDIYKAWHSRTLNNKNWSKGKMGISSFCAYDLWAPVKCCWRDVLSEVMGYERMLLWRKFSINCVHPTSAKDFCLGKHQLLPWLFSFYRVFPNHKGFQSNDHLGYIAPIMCRRSNVGYCILFIKQKWNN